MGKAIDAWTKIGDNVTDRGPWRVYKLSTRAPLREPKTEDFSNAETAMRAYKKAADALRQGGVYLVNPEGVVAACLWIPPAPRYR